VDSNKPDYTGTFKIEKAWTDGEGNIWFIDWRSYMGGSRALRKISDSGNVMEYNVSFGDPPTEIDPNAYHYYKYRKQD
jgi:hypothetical protein